MSSWQQEGPEHRVVWSINAMELWGEDLVIKPFGRGNEGKANEDYWQQERAAFCTLALASLRDVAL